jgi:hypothetical protein
VKLRCTLLAVGGIEPTLSETSSDSPVSIGQLRNFLSRVQQRFIKQEHNRMLPVKEYSLREQYKRDSSMAYECTEEELQFLIGEFGEMEPIIDAIHVMSGASLETRARDLGCSVTDFPEYWDNEEAKEAS